MSRSKRPRKRYNPPSRTPNVKLGLQSCWLETYFGPLDRFVERLYGDGAIEIGASGVPVCLRPDGSEYDLVAGMWAIATLFEIARLRNASCPDVEPLVNVSGKLNAGQLLSLEDVGELSRCLRELRAFAASQSPSMMVDLILTARIRLEIDKQK